MFSQLYLMLLYVCRISSTSDKQLDALSLAEVVVQLTNYTTNCARTAIKVSDRNHAIILNLIDNKSFYEQETFLLNLNNKINSCTTTYDMVDQTLNDLMTEVIQQKNEYAMCYISSQTFYYNLIQILMNQCKQTYHMIREFAGLTYAKSDLFSVSDMVIENVMSTIDDLDEASVKIGRIQKYYDVGKECEEDHVKQTKNLELLQKKYRQLIQLFPME
ncbi:hypothetical protein ECANGB1_1629 [Enterospora canceri]|uniref:Uncharacterized protein n=1 Tax=Enterospora canceri TaxID=1081671 RepID=A0A1Y1S6D1_9MICR|nr:hypothetical protein ECANGB1_1629 [Enterospora canceri]